MPGLLKYFQEAGHRWHQVRPAGRYGLGGYSPLGGPGNQGAEEARLGDGSSDLEDPLPGLARGA